MEDPSSVAPGISAAISRPHGQASGVEIFCCATYAGVGSLTFRQETQAHLFVTLCFISRPLKCSSMRSPSHPNNRMFANADHVTCGWTGQRSHLTSLMSATLDNSSLVHGFYCSSFSVGYVAVCALEWCGDSLHSLPIVRTCWGHLKWPVFCCRPRGVRLCTYNRHSGDGQRAPDFSL